MSWIMRMRKGEKRSEGGKLERVASLWTDRGGGTEPSQFWRLEKENPIKDKWPMPIQHHLQMTDCKIREAFKSNFWKFLRFCPN